ncbi:hypothetical protein [Dactylosporangium sp. CS-033363]|uniref:hypothetical protein n=1 Tax=Dactylosporangium sp. CS-033363 TaxID=3239935 RepID=UPI003D8D82BB
MSGRSYLLAARIPMSRTAFETWLDGPEARERLSARAADGTSLARHRDGILEVYLYDYYEAPDVTATELRLLTAAGRLADAESPIMYWGGDVSWELPLPGMDPITVMLVGPEGSRVTTAYRLDEVLTWLRPAEEAFLAAMEDV